MENLKKLNNIRFHNIAYQKYWYPQNCLNPIRETRVSKLVFITIPSLKFWALVYIYLQLLLFFFVYHKLYKSEISMLYWWIEKLNFKISTDHKPSLWSCEFPQKNGPDRLSHIKCLWVQTNQYIDKPR